MRDTGHRDERAVVVVVVVFSFLEKKEHDKGEFRFLRFDILNTFQKATHNMHHHHHYFPSISLSFNSFATLPSRRIRENVEDANG